MPFTRPTLSQLRDRAESDFADAFNLRQVLRNSVLGVSAKALAGLVHTLFGYLDFVSRQVFPDQAEQEFLQRWATIWGISRTAATFPQFTIEHTGTDGGSIPIGTVIQRSDGVQYTATTSGIIAGGTALVDYKANEAGAANNVEVADVLSLLSPITDVDSDSTVNTIIIEGDDEETDETLRTRLLNRIQQPPAGGTAQDYINEALAVAGVTRAWVFPLNRGAGTVDVSFVEDNESPIIPSAPKVAEVQAAIDAFKPVTADSLVFAPVAVDLDITMNLEPNTLEVQEAVTAQLEDMVFRDAEVAGSYKDALSTNDGTILISRINEAISIATGEEDHLVTVPAGDFTVSTGEIVTLGTITFNPFP